MMCFSERYSLRFDLGRLTLLDLSVKIPFKISYFMRHLVKTFCAFQLFIQRPLEESSHTYYDPPTPDATKIDQFQRFQLGIPQGIPNVSMSSTVGVTCPSIPMTPKVPATKPRCIRRLGSDGVWVCLYGVFPPNKKVEVEIGVCNGAEVAEHGFVLGGLFDWHSEPICFNDLRTSKGIGTHFC